MKSFTNRTFGLKEFMNAADAASALHETRNITLMDVSIRNEQGSV